jgi:hypothetical protein
MCDGQTRRRHGTDNQATAAELVLEHAEMLSREWSV